jgi:ubiquinone/menaquinone biosynthesis C-methylase UbiE
MSTMDEQRKLQKQQWSAVAAAWDRWYDWFEGNTLPLNEWLCQQAGLAPGHKVLDLACGSGQPSLTAATRVLPGGSVTATDISPDMVAVTRRRAADAGLENVEVRVMDAEKLELDSEAFDAVTCRWGLMFCPDPARAAGEIHRVLKPGGRFAVAVWDEPARNSFFTALGGVLSRFVDLPPPDPKVPGVFRLAGPGALDVVLRAGGFDDVRVEALPLTFVYDSLEQYWDNQSAIAAPLKAAIDTMSPDDVVRLKAAVFEGLAPHLDGGQVRLTATPLCATGVR